MKSIYTFEVADDLNKYQNDITNFHTQLNAFETYLVEQFQLKDKPKGVFWTSRFVMEEVLEKPVPAFTRDEAIYMCADSNYWEQYFKALLPEALKDKYTSFYEMHTKDEMLAILGHELAHHIDLFLAEFDEEHPTCEDMWFEEGMATYLPRKFFFDDELFNNIYHLEKSLYEYYLNDFGDLPLEHFTYDIYSHPKEYIMFHYWMSFIKVTEMVKRANGDASHVFKLYHDWDTAGRKVSLLDYFEAHI